MVERGDERLVPEIPHTIARSIAIGNPADGLFASRAIRDSGGWAQAVSDEKLVDAIKLLAETTGVFAETAGGATLAAALELAAAGKFNADDELVLCITGNGLKTTDAVRDVLPQAPVVAAKFRDVAALVEKSGG
jgi:threonine synthase